MTTNNFIEKYNNLNIEEEFINNYLYRPNNIKSSEIIQFKKPKKFNINKSIEDFRTNKKGNLKTLREFQNLYIHKFIIKPRKKEKKIKFHFSFGIKKENKNINVNKNNYNKKKYFINDEIEKQRPISQIDYLKRANILLNSSKSRNTSYYIKKRSDQLINKINQYNIRTRNINSSSTINKNNCDNNKKLKNIRNTPSLSYKCKKSKLTLIKELSQKILNTKNKETNDNLKNSNISYFNESNNSRNFNNEINKYKSFGLIKNRNNLKSENINHVKYREISRYNCNLSDAYVIEKQICPNSANKIKLQKRPKIPLRLFSSDVRQMSTLEKYYLKFGVFPY